MLSLERRGTKRTLLPVYSEFLMYSHVTDWWIIFGGKIPCIYVNWKSLKRVRSLLPISTASSCNNYRWIKCMNSSPQITTSLQIVAGTHFVPSLSITHTSPVAPNKAPRAPCLFPDTWRLQHAIDYNLCLSDELRSMDGRDANKPISQPPSEKEKTVLPKRTRDSLSYWTEPFRAGREPHGHPRVSFFGGFVWSFWRHRPRQSDNRPGSARGGIGILRACSVRPRQWDELPAHGRARSSH